jgi:hypothetical protein
MSGAGTVRKSARCSRGRRVLGRCRVRWTIWLSPFCTTPIRQASTDPERGSRARGAPAHFLPVARLGLMNFFEDDALARPAAISRQSRGQKFAEDLHDEDRLPGTPRDPNRNFATLLNSILVLQSARYGLQ